MVHGSDGLDEITTTGPTLVFEIRDGNVERRTLEPADFAVRTAASEELRGGGKARNCEIARAVLEGERGAPRDIVIVNAAAALVAAGTRRDVSRRHGDRGGVDRFRRGPTQSRSAPSGLVRWASRPVGAPKARVLRVLRNLETAGCLVYIPGRYMPNDTQVAKWGKSLAVRIPKALAGKARLAEGDRLSLDLTDDGIIVLRSTRRCYALRDLVSKITSKNRHSETDWGPLAGREPW